MVSADLANANSDSGFPVEPLQSTSAFARVKSPAQGMHFTTGKELRVLGDGDDANAWQWLCTTRTSGRGRYALQPALADPLRAKCLRCLPARANLPSN